MDFTGGWLMAAADRRGLTRELQGAGSRLDAWAYQREECQMLQTALQHLHLGCTLLYRESQKRPHQRPQARHQDS